ncbi:hypothetical protein [Streptomyces vinaceus]|uniref:hypothetical protein n=1 Tax=Streptomyces vinaceus TaxID=1960 RepID=UPI00369FF01D
MTDPFNHDWTTPDYATATCGKTRPADAVPATTSQLMHERRHAPVTCPDCIATKGLADHAYKQQHLDWLDEQDGGMRLR